MKKKRLFSDEKVETGDENFAFNKTLNYILAGCLILHLMGHCVQSNDDYHETKFFTESTTKLVLMFVTFSSNSS